MNHETAIQKVLACMFGVTGGGLTYPKIHLMFDPSLWGTIQEKAMSLFYTLTVAFLSGAAGYGGGMLVKKWAAVWIKRKKNGRK